MSQITQFIIENWQKLFIIGIGGIGLVILIIFLLRGPNGRWRWDN